MRKVQITQTRREPGVGSFLAKELSSFSQGFAVPAAPVFGNVYLAVYVYRFDSNHSVPQHSSGASSS